MRFREVSTVVRTRVGGHRYPDRCTSAVWLWVSDTRVKREERGLFSPPSVYRVAHLTVLNECNVRGPVRSYTRTRTVPAWAQYMYRTEGDAQSAPTVRASRGSCPARASRYQPAQYQSRYRSLATVRKPSAPPSQSWATHRRSSTAIGHGHGRRRLWSREHHDFNRRFRRRQQSWLKHRNASRPAHCSPPPASGRP